MLNRRSFLRRSLATGLVLPVIAPVTEKLSPQPANDLEKIVAGSKSLDLLGRPQSWSLVREGLHPISPERVIMDGDGCYSRNHSEEEALRATLTDPAQLHSACVGKPFMPVEDDDGSRCQVCRYPLSVSLPAEKLDLIFRLMRVITDYYRVPHLFPKWARGCARRESLASTGFYRGAAMPHQFQSEGTVLVNNPPVDWWTVLFPEGANWNAIDDEPVFAMITHVFRERHTELPGLSFRVWALTQGVAFGKTADDWKRIAQMDRINAAQAVNREILLTFRDSQEHL